MTRRGLERAIEHAATLPWFGSKEEAEPELIRIRDSIRAEMLRLGEEHDVALDLGPESLKLLEKWYFRLCEEDGFEAIGTTRDGFELGMGYYNGFVHTENEPPFHWVVEVSDLTKGRYQLGIRKGLFTLMIGPASRLHELRHNKRRESMYRRYKSHVD